jgi:hypothetical protein
MIIKIGDGEENRIRGLVSRYNFCGTDVKVNDAVGIWAVKDRQFGLKGAKGIVRRIYFSRFWHYESVWLSLFIPSFDKTIWVEADACDYGEGAWALYAWDKAQEHLGKKSEIGA